MIVETLTRRRFIQDTGGVVAASVTPPLLSRPQPEPQWRSDQTEEYPVIKDRLSVPLQRDAIGYGNTYYLIGNNKVYPMSASDFAEYRYKSMFDERGRKVFTSQGAELLDLPRGRVTNDKFIIDRYSGGLRSSKNKGGVITVFIMGSFSDQGIIYNSTPTKELYPVIRGENGLGALGWTDLDSLFFTFGKEGVENFNPADTVKDPLQTFQEGCEFMDNIDEVFPLAQIDLVDHSWGGVVGIEIARRYHHMINTLVLVSDPARGLNKNDIVWTPIPMPREFAAAFLKQSLRASGIDEKMTDYLFKIWKDKKYQEQLDTFVAEFRGMGRVLLELTSVDDRIVPVESTLLRGTPNVLNGRLVQSAWKLVLDLPRDPIDALVRHHWAMLNHPMSTILIKTAIGQNRAV